MLASVSLSYYIAEPLSIGTISHKLWVPRIYAAVAQQEVVVAAAEADASLVEEKVEEDNEKDEGGEEEVVADEDTETSVSTKLYFGNLPYSVDSAQLAGLIQDYGSAELIEVCMQLIYIYIHVCIYSIMHSHIIRNFDYIKIHIYDDYDL